MFEEGSLFDPWSVWNEEGGEDLWVRFFFCIYRGNKERDGAE